MNASDWEVRAFLHDSLLNEERHYLCTPSMPSMRSWLETLFNWRKDESDSYRDRYNVALVVTHRPSGSTKRMRIVRDGDKFMAQHDGDLITLDTSVSIMKERLMAEEMSKEELEMSRGPDA